MDTRARKVERYQTSVTKTVGITKTRVRVGCLKIRNLLPSGGLLIALHNDVAVTETLHGKDPSSNE